MPFACAITPCCSKQHNEDIQAQRSGDSWSRNHTLNCKQTSTTRCSFGSATRVNIGVLCFAVRGCKATRDVTKHWVHVSGWYNPYHAFKIARFHKTRNATTQVPFPRQSWFDSFETEQGQNNQLMVENLNKITGTRKTNITEESLQYIAEDKPMCHSIIASI